jgi:hypothetical protein
MIRSEQSSLRRRERGGLTILVAFMLLAIMSIAAIQVGSSGLRDLATSGNASTGRKASEAAEAGLDWTLTWMYLGATAPTALQTTVASQVDQMGSLLGGSLNPSQHSDPLPSDGPTAGAEP